VAHPANQDGTNRPNQAPEDRHQVYHLHHGSQQISSKVEALPANAYDADLQTTTWASALTTPKEVTHRRGRTIHSLRTGTDNTKSNNRCLSMINSHKTHRLLSGSCPMEEVQWGRIGFKEVGNAEFDSNDKQHTTTSDRFEVNHGVGAPTSSHIKWEHIRHVQGRSVPYCTWDFDQSWKWGNAMLESAHQWQRDEQLYHSKTAKTASFARRTSLCHYSRPQCPGTGTQNWKSKNGVPGLEYGALITGANIGGASCTSVGLRLRFGISLDPVQGTWCRLATWPTFCSVIPR